MRFILYHYPSREYCCSFIRELLNGISQKLNSLHFALGNESRIEGEQERV